MDILARCFLLVFAELYAGGMLAIAIPPFHDIERGFYKSTAGIYVGFGLLAFAGRIALIVSPTTNARPTTTLDIIELVVWVLSLAAGIVYVRSLWGENYAQRARAFVVCWMGAILALALGAQAFRLGGWLSIETILYPISFVISSLVLGAVTTGMLLGHWYLIDNELSIEPFRTMLKFFATTIGLQVGSIAVSCGLIAIIGTAPSGAALQRLLNEHDMLLLARLLAGPVASAGFAWMIWQTLKIPQTMAATGLFYIAILSVVVGEMLSRFILFRTSLPL